MASDEPEPGFSDLGLTLSRDQGLFHTASGAGSDSVSLSHPAEGSHARMAPRILSSSSASHALGPENLPEAPTTLPVMPDVEKLALNGSALSDGEYSQPPSGTVTPTLSTATATPELGTQSPNLDGISSTKVTPGGSRTGTPTAHASAPLMEQKKSSASIKEHHANGHKPEKKGVFGKLFGGGGNSANASSVSLPGASSGDEGGAVLGRKPSKKEKKEMEERDRQAQAHLQVPPKLKRDQSSDRGSHKGDKEDKPSLRPRAPSQSGSAKEKEGMGAALNEFMRNKVSRKSSVTSKRSDDGKSDRGSEYGGSQNGDARSSLSKKYGVCEKVAIGKGATATVKLAHKWDRTTERLYAVKEFRKRRKNETEKEYVKKLTSEFCISSTLHHHNVVETVDLVQDEQMHWCEVMEYCPGGDLYAAIKKGSMDSAEINSYFKQILSGVAYLHSMGVAHRDIKPENLLLDAKGHVKITDFGVSDVFRMCWEKTTHLSKGLCGSEPYIAPEQFEQKEYDARLVDVWACAVVYYCMTFQELPWRVAKPSDPSFGPYMQMFPTAQSAPAPLSNLAPRECRKIIRHMLDPDPKTRYTTEQILRDPWFAAIEVIPALEVIPVPPASIVP